MVFLLGYDAAAYSVRTSWDREHGNAFLGAASWPWVSSSVIPNTCAMWFGSCQVVVIYAFSLNY